MPLVCLLCEILAVGGTISGLSPTTEGLEITDAGGSRQSPRAKAYFFRDGACPCTARGTSGASGLAKLTVPGA